MTHRRLKAGFFVLEGLNSLATTIYFYYIYFFMAKEFGFGNRDNLLLSAANGFLYTFAAWYAGRFGQKHGYFKALALGFSLMAASLAIGGFTVSLRGQIAVMLTCTLGMCFTWPTLQALVSEKETPAGLQTMVGIYNVVWAGMSGLTFFTGGALLQAFGLRSLFWIPATVHIVQLGLLFWLKGQASRVVHLPANSDLSLEPLPRLNPRPIARARIFLKMAWLANPFAYVAVNSIIAVIPGLALRFELSPMLAGFFCSIWLFARLGTFLALWLWAGWHYRFRWFIIAFLLLIAGFASTLLLTKPWAIIIAQVGFGMGLGLIYYSSLFYSMDVGETKGEHGGFHEAAIGVGLFGGPAVGALALYFFPNKPDSGTFAVSGLLILGLLSLLALSYRAHAALSPLSPRSQDSGRQ
ncbi:MAG: MFS transporter [Pedosphaera sp.]|nr:MFS transporter [Pedosphaera sp.]